MTQEIAHTHLDHGRRGLRQMRSPPTSFSERRTGAPLVRGHTGADPTKLRQQHRDRKHHIFSFMGAKRASLEQGVTVVSFAYMQRMRPGRPCLLVFTNRQIWPTTAAPTK